MKGFISYHGKVYLFRDWLNAIHFAVYEHNLVEDYIA